MPTFEDAIRICEEVAARRRRAAQIEELQHPDNYLGIATEREAALAATECVDALKALAKQKR